MLDFLLRHTIIIKRDPRPEFPMNRYKEIKTNEIPRV